MLWCVGWDGGVVSASKNIHACQQRDDADESSACGDQWTSDRGYGYSRHAHHDEANLLVLCVGL